LKQSNFFNHTENLFSILNKNLYSDPEATAIDIFKWGTESVLEVNKQQHNKHQNIICARYAKMAKIDRK